MTMQYALDELLAKLGAPEVRERGQIRWHYFDRQDEEIGGFAEVRLLDGGALLVAEMKHVRPAALQEGDADEGGHETFYLHARRSGTYYEITKIAFDGEDYAHPQKAVIELGLSLFHARALDISILMVEQAFNKEDVLRPVIDGAPRFEGVPVRKKAPALQKEEWGVVIPFRPRKTAAALH